MSKDSKIKVCMYIRTFYTQVIGKREHFIWPATWIFILEHQKILYYMGHKKCSFLPENLCTNIECLDVPVKFYFRFFFLIF
jgi:hypothetical protein